MAFPSFTSGLWSFSLFTVLMATTSSPDSGGVSPLQPMTQDETVAVGGTVTLTCHVAESDNSSLQWSNTVQQTLYFGAKRALRDSRINLHHSTSTELSITIGEVQLSDEGEYTCTLFTMPLMTTTSTVTVLGVPGKPQITGYEDAIPEGGRVTLTCTTTGSKPPATLRWYRGNELMEAAKPALETLESGNVTYLVSSELVLDVRREDDNALITCVVEHPSLTPGDKRTEQALRVLFTPVVSIQADGNSLPKEGQKFHLQCTGKGNPSPLSYSWERKDGEIPSLAKVDGASLVFETLNKSDNGVYLCQIDNGIGKSQAEYTLQVQDSDASPLGPFPPTSISPFSPHSVSSLSPTSFSPDSISSFSPSSITPFSPSSISSISPLSPTSISPLSPTSISPLSSTSISPLSLASVTPYPSLPPANSSPSSSSSSSSSSPLPPTAPSSAAPSPSSSDAPSMSSSDPPSPLSPDTPPPPPPPPSSVPAADGGPDSPGSPSSSFPNPGPSSPAVTTLQSNVLFPELPLGPAPFTLGPAPVQTGGPSPSLSPTLPPNSTVAAPPNGAVTDEGQNKTDEGQSKTEPTAMSTSSGVDHAVIGGVVAVIVFILLCLLIVLGRYLIRHKGTYLTHEAKGSDDAPDADTAIINAEGGHSGAEDKKEYFI